MYKFEIGMELVELPSTHMFTVIALEDSYFMIKNHKNGLSYEESYDVIDLIPLDIYESPLYNALKEQE